jgi:proteasome lid subunit RPN8/RPN11
MSNENSEIAKGNSVYVGKNEKSDNVKIYITNKILVDIDEYLSNDTSIETGGVLCGYIKDNREIFISDFIKAEYTEATLVSLTFTHKTWEAINSVMETKSKDLQIIGWFHSHPGHTVFMSGYDEFIQNNFFDKDYMVSYIFDPIKNERGFFVTENKSIRRLSGYYLIKEDFSGMNKAMQSGIIKKVSKNNRRPNLTYLLLLVIFIVIIFSVFIISLLRINSRELDVNRIEINELKEKNILLDLKADSLQQLLNLRNASSMDYIIGHGETLKSIAEKFMNDSLRYTDIIILNNLRDENDIREGQKIKIPLE